VITEGWQAFGVLGDDTEPEVLVVKECEWPEAEVSSDGFFGIFINTYGDNPQTALCKVFATSTEKAVERWKAIAHRWNYGVVAEYDVSTLRMQLWSDE
jgi:hypothetical protein